MRSCEQCPSNGYEGDVLDSFGNTVIYTCPNKDAYIPDENAEPEQLLPSTIEPWYEMEQAVLLMNTASVLALCGSSLFQSLWIYICKFWWIKIGSKLAYIVLFNKYGLKDIVIYYW